MLASRLHQFSIFPAIGNALSTEGLGDETGLEKRSYSAPYRVHQLGTKEREKCKSMSQNNGRTKRSEKGLLTPDNCVVAFIDHQPQMLWRFEFRPPDDH
jgi:hypothetical protein